MLYVMINFTLERATLPMVVLSLGQFCGFYNSFTLAGLLTIRYAKKNVRCVVSSSAVDFVIWWTAREMISLEGPIDYSWELQVIIPVLGY